MEELVAILLLVVPGFIANEIYKKLNRSVPDRTEIENTAISLAYSVLIMIVDFALLFIFGYISSFDLSAMKTNFSSLSFIVKYISLTAANCFYVSLLLTVFSPLILWFCNIIRKLLGKNCLEDTTSILESLDDGNEHIVRIKKNNEIEFGILDRIESQKGIITAISLRKQKEVEEILHNGDQDALKAKRTFFSPTADFQITDYFLNKSRSKKGRYFLSIIISIILFAVTNYGLFALFDYLSKQI